MKPVSVMTLIVMQIRHQVALAFNLVIADSCNPLQGYVWVCTGLHTHFIIFLWLYWLT